MEKKETLRNFIKQNSNLSDEFKCNIGTLTDTLVTILPENNYSSYEGILSNLKITNDKTLDKYSSYNRNDNELKLNLEKSFEDRIDLQHLFLHELLKMNKNPQMSGFNNGMAEEISSIMNNDESMKKLYPLESLSISLLSKIVDSNTLLNGFMNNHINDIIIDLESKGITQDEFNELINKFNNIPESFGDIEVFLTNMYVKKISHDLENGNITNDDISNKFSEFEELLITKKSELNALYPHHDFINVKGLENVKSNLDKSIINIEDVGFIDINERVK